MLPPWFTQAAFPRGGGRRHCGRPFWHNANYRSTCSAHPDWGYQQIKDRILLTVEASAALAGKMVTGGRLNATQALATPAFPAAIHR
jgi:hypothetical protein